MPIIWRYLLQQYVKVLSFSLFSFLIALFVCQMRRLAQFALLGAGWGEVARFGLYLIPYVLPIALPIACLIASIFLFQRLSNSHEIVALRASGLSFLHILAPTLLLSLGLCMVNFYIASELATHCHLLGTRMKNDKSQLNPLLLLRNSEIFGFGEIFVEMRTKHGGEEANRVILGFHNPYSKRINLFTAQKLYHEGELLRGENISILAPLGNPDNQYDKLLIENEAEIEAPANGLQQLLGQATLWKPKNHYLKLSLLLRKLRHAKEMIRQTVEPQEVKSLRLAVAQGEGEFMRRLSLGLATLTFTLLGSAFGMDLSRKQSALRITEAVALAALFLACFLTAGALADKIVLAFLLYLAPHVLIGMLSLQKIRRLNRGFS